GGIAALSTYLDQKRIDAENSLKTYQLEREFARDQEMARHNQASEANQAAAAGPADYRKSQADTAKQRAGACDRRTDALNRHTAASGAGGSATERIVNNILADAKANGKKISYADAVRMAHGASTGDRATLERLAQGYARGKVGQFGTGDDYTKALEEGRKMYGALGNEAADETDPLNLNAATDQDPLGMFGEEGASSTTSAPSTRAMPRCPTTSSRRASTRSSMPRR